jgi:hypothetical protein
VTFRRFALVLALLEVAPPAVPAQTDLTVEVGASQIGPPLGTDAESSRFGVGGVRFAHYAATGSGIAASMLLGRTFGDASGGDFFSASLSSSMVEDWGGGWIGGMDLRLLGFGIRAPFPYRALAAEGGPVLRFRRGALAIEGAAVAGVGRSSIELWRVEGGLTRTFVDDLWRIGGTGALMLGAGPVRVGVTGGVHESRGGRFGSGGGRVLVTGSWGAVELTTDLWTTPLGSDVTGGLTFVLPVSGWSFRGFAGRSEPDPLTLAQPGSGSGGLLVGRALYARALSPTGASSDISVGYQVIDLDGARARVRLTLEPPASAERVEVLGDFTLWEAVSMERLGGRWSLELDVQGGTHHYGYLVDGEWYVPDDGRPVVADEWGRSSAILVIEGVD